MRSRRYALAMAALISAPGLAQAGDEPVPVAGGTTPTAPSTAAGDYTVEVFAPDGQTLAARTFTAF